MCAKNRINIFSRFLDIPENVEWPRFYWTTRYIALNCAVIGCAIFIQVIVVGCTHAQFLLPGKYTCVVLLNGLVYDGIMC